MKFNTFILFVYLFSAGLNIFYASAVINLNEDQESLLLNIRANYPRLRDILPQNDQLSFIKSYLVYRKLIDQDSESAKIILDTTHYLCDGLVKLPCDVDIIFHNVLDFSNKGQLGNLQEFFSSRLATSKISEATKIQFLKQTISRLPQNQWGIFVLALEHIKSSLHHTPYELKAYDMMQCQTNLLETVCSYNLNPFDKVVSALDTFFQHYSMEIKKDKIPNAKKEFIVLLKYSPLEDKLLERPY